MSIRESAIEKKVCDHARKNGWLVFKFTSPGNRSVPDRLFIKSGLHVFIEFKAEGKKTSKLQEKTIKDMNRQGCKVHTTDNAEWGKTIIDYYDREIREKTNNWLKYPEAGILDNMG